MCKIVVLSTVHHYQDARIFFKEIPSLKKAYSDICFIVPVEGKNNIFEENRIKIIPLQKPNTKFERIKLQLKAWKIISEMEPQIVHFHDPELILLGFLIKKILKIKVIFDIHENISASFKDNLWIPKLIKPILPTIFRTFEKFLIKDFDALLIAEESYRKTYGNKPITILNYPIFDEKIYNKKDFSGKLNLVYIGGIWERRGAFQMLRLFNRLVKDGFNLSFFLVGPFVPSKLQISIEKYISENNLSNRVKIFGRKTLKEVYEILQECHIGLSLMQNIGNYNESLSTKIFDYMLAGIPYIVSDFEIYNDYTITNNTGITANYDDENELYDRVKRLIINKEELETMSKNGFNSIKEKWNWNTQEKKLLLLYKNLLL